MEREGGEKGREYAFYSKFAEVRMKDRWKGKEGRREGEYLFYNKFAEVRMMDRWKGKEGRREGNMHSTVSLQK